MAVAEEAAYTAERAASERALGLCSHQAGEIAQSGPHHPRVLSASPTPRDARLAEAVMGCARWRQMSALSPGAAVSNRSTPEEGVHGRMHYAAAGGTYAAHEHRRHAHAQAAGGRR